MALINKYDVLFFENDQEFEEFAVAPYATIVKKDGKPVTWKGEYSDAYKECISQGKCFVINNGRFDSSTNRRHCVIRRVLVPKDGTTNRKYTSVQLPVQNLGHISGSIVYWVSYDGQILNPDKDKPVHAPEAAMLIVQKWTELYGSNAEFEELASSIGRRDEEQMKTLIDKTSIHEGFKEKLVVTPLVMFIEY